MLAPPRLSHHYLLLVTASPVPDRGAWWAETAPPGCAAREVSSMGLERFSRIVTAPAALALALTGCAGSDRPQLPPATFVAQPQVPGEQYIIGPLDKLNIFVCRHPELSSQVPVRPVGRITTPPLRRIPAVGQDPAPATPT